MSEMIYEWKLTDYFYKDYKGRMCFQSTIMPIGDVKIVFGSTPHFIANNVIRNVWAL